MSDYLAQIEAEKHDCDSDIAGMDPVLARKQVYYARAADICTAAGDHHAAANWMHTGVMAQALRDRLAV